MQNAEIPYGRITFPRLHYDITTITIGKGRGMERKKKKKKNWNLAAINARPSDKSKSKVGQELYRADNRRVV